MLAPFGSLTKARRFLLIERLFMPKQSTLFSLHNPSPRIRQIAEECASEPIVTTLFPSGDLEVSDIINGERVHRRYSGYSKAEAVAMFREQTKPTILDIGPI